MKTSKYTEEQTSCPYPDCHASDIFIDNDPDKDHRCPECGKRFRVCSHCHSLVRSFSRFCRNCGSTLTPSDDDWPLFRGDARCMGLSEFVIDPFDKLTLREFHSFQVSGRCRGILFAEGYMIVGSASGQIQIWDILSDPPVRVQTFDTGSNMFACPAVHEGWLYVSTEKSVCAYPLFDLVQTPSSQEPNRAWEVSLDGKPLRALFPFGDCLYINTYSENTRTHEIQRVSLPRGSQFRPGPKPETICNRPKLSFIAGHKTPSRNQVYFISSDGDQIFLHGIDHEKNPPEMRETNITEKYQGFGFGIPISVFGARVFSVMDPNGQLVRLDADTGDTNKKFYENVHHFALAGINDPTIACSNGVYFYAPDKLESLREQRLNCTGGVIVLKDRVAAVAMNDGAIYFYNLKAPGVLPLTWNVADTSDTITTMAAYRNMVAVGTDKGSIRICRLQKKNP